jgi:hypothetical protein
MARGELEDVTRLQTALRRAKLQIAGVMEPDRRASLTAQWTDANASLREVVAAIHAFDQERVQERLTDSSTRMERLVAALAKR